MTNFPKPKNELLNLTKLWHKKMLTQWGWVSFAFLHRKVLNLIRMKLNEARAENNNSTANCGENESSVDLREIASSCWVSMICQWVSGAICWLSQTAGDYNYPGAEGGAREARSVKRLPLHSCMYVAHSQGPRSCTSKSLYRMWLLNLFTLGEFSLCNQYSVLPQSADGTELRSDTDSESV